MNSETVNSAYDTIRNKKWLNTIVILTRFLIGFAFIPSGLKKIMGVRFTQLSISEPIGFFFEALYRSGIYWNFLGWAQLIAALLLMTQRFATLGAIFFFFIISNIWMITLSLHFSGTWVITSLMLLAVVMLLAWDMHKLKYIVYPDRYNLSAMSFCYPTYNRTWVITGFILFAWSITGFMLIEKMGEPVKLFSRLWLAGIGLTVCIALYKNRSKNKKSSPA